jgi:hypothetical protein
MAVAAWGALLAGCGAGADAVVANGGGGIEIPNGLVVTVLDGAGTPVAGAQVSRLANSRWGELTGTGSPVVLDSAVTDSRGMASLKSAGADAWIEVRSMGSGVRLRTQDTGDVHAVIEPLQAFAGRWPDSLPRPERLWLAGTRRYSELSALGDFRFDSLPPGAYAIVAGMSNGLHPAGSVTLGVHGLERFELKLDTSGLLLDDFEDGDILWRPVSLFGQGYWWRMANNAKGGLQAVFGISDLAKSVVAEGGNHYLSMNVSAASMSEPWANFGLSLGAGHVWPDFRRLKAVRMRLRGHGRWTFALSMQGAGGVELWRTGVLALDSTWTSVVLPASAFGRVEGKDTGSRDAMVRWMTAPLFQTSENGTLEVDDLVFEGISVGDWSKPD